MGKRGAKLPGFCLNRIRPHARVRSPPLQPKLDSEATKTDPKTENSGEDCEKIPGDGAKNGDAVGRKVMIVVDSSFAAKGAVQWALSHTVQSQDVVILLHVIKPSKQQGVVKVKLILPPLFSCLEFNYLVLKTENFGIGSHRRRFQQGD